PSAAPPGSATSHPTTAPAPWSGSRTGPRPSWSRTLRTRRWRRSRVRCADPAARATGSTSLVGVVVGPGPGPLLDPFPRTLQSRPTQCGELLAALPQRQRLLQGGAALQFADHGDELLPCRLVAQLVVAGGLVGGVRRHWSSSWGSSVTRAPMRPSARCSTRGSPGLTCPVDDTACPSASIASA